MAYTTIDKPSDYFNTKLYTGDASSSRDITGVGFQPDFTWIKDRDGGFSHILGNVVSGNNKFLVSSASSAESTDSTKFRTFVSDGFQVGNHNGVNANSNNYASWNWKANGAGVANTDGSISSTVSANTTSGFSIGTYTGNATNNATVGHGLSSAPQMIIVKQLGSGGDNWQVYWNDGTERNGFLNLTNAFNTPAATQQWGDNAPTSSVFTLGSDTATNVAGNLVFYAFHSVQGYSKFSSYTGNGNDNGTFVYTGFKPAFVLVKRADATGNWSLIDNTRDPFNVTYHFLEPNVSDAEFTPSGPQAAFDFCSQGFKCRSTNGAINASGGTYIYMAFAEAPLVGTNNVPCTAR